MKLYYIKFINTTTGNVVGYYKEKGSNSVSKLKKGIKYWDNEKDAMQVCLMLDNGFIRDEDRKYYIVHAVVIGEPGHKPLSKPSYQIQSEEERKDEVDAFIRQNYNRIR